MLTHENNYVLDVGSGPGWLPALDGGFGEVFPEVATAKFANWSFASTLVGLLLVDAGSLEEPGRLRMP